MFTFLSRLAYNHEKYIYICRRIGVKRLKKETDMNKLKRLPVGIQTFEKIVNGDFLYVDKTEYIWNMTHPVSYTHLTLPTKA